MHHFKAEITEIPHLVAFGHSCHSFVRPLIFSSPLHPKWNSWLRPWSSP